MEVNYHEKVSKLTVTRRPNTQGYEAIDVDITYSDGHVVRHTLSGQPNVNYVPPKPWYVEEHDVCVLCDENHPNDEYHHHPAHTACIAQFLEDLDARYTITDRT
jgi:hypothetical protein